MLLPVSVDLLRAAILGPNQKDSVRPTMTHTSDPVRPALTCTPGTQFVQDGFALDEHALGQPPRVVLSGLGVEGNARVQNKIQRRVQHVAHLLHQTRFVLVLGTLDHLLGRFRPVYICHHHVRGRFGHAVQGLLQRVDFVLKRGQISQRGLTK